MTAVSKLAGIRQPRVEYRIEWVWNYDADRTVYTVEVTLDRAEGKFASRDEMAEQLIEALESADPSTVDGIGSDGMSSYEVSDWVVTES